MSISVDHLNDSLVHECEQAVAFGGIALPRRW
jgi:hypothetical protein